MNNQSLGISKGIELLRTICCFLVVIAHCQSKSVVSNDYGLSGYIQFVLSGIIGTAATPIFYFISGYLFSVGFKEWNFDVWKQKLKRRVKSLVFPYLLWNLIMLILFSTLFHFFMSESWTCLLDERGLYGVFWSWNGVPVNYPFWFLRDLIILVLLFPIIYVLVRYTSYIGLLLLVVMYLTQVVIPIDGISTKSLLFFYFGALAQLKGNWQGYGRAFNTIGLGLCLSVLVLCMLYRSDSNLLVRLFHVVEVPVFFSIAVSVKENKCVEGIFHLSGCSFFVFAFHAIVVFCMQQFLEKYTPEIPSIASYFLCISFTFMICIGLFWLLKRFFPKVLFVLNGLR